jgi:hypothetical protein
MTQPPTQGEVINLADEREKRRRAIEEREVEDLELSLLGSLLDRRFR